MWYVMWPQSYASSLSKKKKKIKRKEILNQEKYIKEKEKC